MSDSRDYQVGLSFSVLHRAAFSYFQEKLKHLGIGPGQQAYLLALSPGQKTKQEELARRLGVNKANVSRAVQKLESTGLVTRDSHGFPEKALWITLTPEGSRVQEKTAQSAKLWITELKKGLNAEEWDNFSVLLLKMTQRVMQAHDGSSNVQENAPQSSSSNFPFDPFSS